MAKHLAYIFATEQDRVNCPFYFKTGACRHGDRCSRYHNKPTVSPTLLLANMYQRPDMAVPGGGGATAAAPMDPRKAQEHFEDFYEDLYAELSKFGDIESLIVCDNLSDHMVGNVYVQFREEDHAVAALSNLTGRFYSGRPIIPEFSPVTDLREATCRDNTCMRGGLCNFMHLKKISKELRRQLFDRYGRKRSRSRSPVGRRGHDDRHERGRYHGGRGRRERSPGPGGRRNRSPVRESSAERRAKIEQWNREREQGGDGRKNEHGNHSGGGYSQSDGEYRGNGPPRQNHAEYDY